MKKLLYLSFCTIILASCAMKGAFAKKYNLPDKVSYSTGYQQFVDEIEQESQGLESWSDYEPSNMMREKFSFVTLPNGEIGVEGFIQVVPMYFDASAFEQGNGGYLTFFSEGIYQYKLPVGNIKNVAWIRGVVQIDVIRKQR